MRFDYHDATLTTILVDWKTGKVIFTFRLSVQPNQTIELTVQEATQLNLKRLLPWGKSVSVNQLRLVTVDSSHQRLEIEMQSGDTIVIDNGGVSENVIQ